MVKVQQLIAAIDCRQQRQPDIACISHLLQAPLLSVLAWHSKQREVGASVWQVGLLVGQEGFEFEPWLAQTEAMIVQAIKHAAGQRPPRQDGGDASHLSGVCTVLVHLRLTHEHHKMMTGNLTSWELTEPGPKAFHLSPR